MMIKRIILNTTMALAVLAATVVLTAGISHADAPKCPDGNSAKAEVLQGIGQTGTQCDDTQVNQTFQTIVQILSMLIGIASVVVILIAGFKYMTSGGEAGRVSNAKSTLIYALVGLFVAAIAQLLIHFVLFQASDAANPKCPIGQHGTPPNCEKN